MTLEIWAVPYDVFFSPHPDDADFMPDRSDDYVILSRDNDGYTWGEFLVGNASRLANPEHWAAWESLIRQHHLHWAEEAQAK